MSTPPNQLLNLTAYRQISKTLDCNEMPNCDFYAVDHDLIAVLDFVMSEIPCSIFESYSVPDSELRQFRSLDEISSLPEFGKVQINAQSVLLQLWIDGTSENVKIAKFGLNPEKCNGSTYRYQISGWGLIQLYLGGEAPAGILHSHTNHNSPARARKWSGSYPELGDPNDWDWKAVEAASRKLNGYIRNNLATSKVGQRPVLPSAARKFALGANAI